MVPGVGLMARPKKTVKKVADSPSAERVAIIHLKGSPEYAAWLEDAHKKTHIAKATIFRVALADWAAKHGLPEPPEL
jgi:hypothetical protein